MTRFDLMFKGTILPDHDPQAVKNAFADLFTIKDPFVIEQLFSGDTFIVRSNLDRKSAAEYFRKVVELGGQAELVASSSVDENDVENNGRAAPAGSAAGRPVGGTRAGEILVRRDDHVDQSWAVNATLMGAEPAISKPAPEDNPEAQERASEEERLRAELTELRLARDSFEATAADELARLQQEQIKSKGQYESEVARVRTMREQATEACGSTLESLRQKGEDTRKQYAEEMERLHQEENEKSRKAETALGELLESSSTAESELLAQASKLEQDKQEIASKAEESISKLETLIDETRRQAERDSAELDKMLEENIGALERHQEFFSQQREDIVHQSAEDADLLQAQIEECRADGENLLTTLTAEQAEEQEKSREAVVQLEEMEGEIEQRWSGELDQLQQQVLLTQRKLESELESLAAREVTLRQELAGFRS